MKTSFIFAALFLCLLASCSTAVVKAPPCDVVTNREDTFVCGHADVMKACKQAQGRPEFVCDKL